MENLAELNPDEIKDEWDKFKVKYRTGSELNIMKDYKEPTRRAIFADNYRAIHKHNIEANDGKHTYWLGVNKFTDMSIDEFRHVYLCKSPTLEQELASRRLSGWSKFNIYHRNVPNSVNWRHRGAVTRVKNQGELSVQHVIDGLNMPSALESGGYCDEVYEFVMRQGGLMSESNYPFRNDFDPTQLKSHKKIVTIEDYELSRDHNEMTLRQIVACIGPVAVGIRINGQKFRDYSRGVCDNCDGPPPYDYHAVVVVGYGTETFNGIDHDYWLIKNSYSEDWGESGYMKLARKGTNLCYIASNCAFPTGVRKVLVII
ncbi:unnamed protein product [Medioppia subpectinata]|uniref:Uncharacterized protein n=1 Tax=Medioppia subpectinata TaxID=1979941 RepID=A0A7R9KTJ5_9ACAR|nr:unnamed protein product [Medioppia subpectinata]CAG2109470.1 unnamed protein product [Medioppia subpectinata]